MVDFGHDGLVRIVYTREGFPTSESENHEKIQEKVITSSFDLQFITDTTTLFNLLIDST